MAGWLSDHNMCCLCLLHASERGSLPGTMGKKLLYLQRSLKQPAPQDDRHLVYVRVETELHQAVLDVSNALKQVNEIGQSCSGEITHFLVRYRSQAFARKCAIIIRDLDLQRNYGEKADASDLVFREMIAGGGDTLQLHYSTILLNEPDINDVLVGILEARIGAVFTLNRRVKQLIKKHFTIFNPREVLSIDPFIGSAAESAPDVLELAEATEYAHGKAIAFLRALLNRCTDVRPGEDITPSSTHIIHIDPNLDVSIDGTNIQLNEARRASILALALLGTDGVSLDKFAAHYCVVPLSASRSVNLPNIFAKATRWLADTLPNFTVKKTGTRRRQLLGISITFAASENTMRNFLKERRENLTGE